MDERHDRTISEALRDLAAIRAASINLDRIESPTQYVEGLRSTRGQLDRVEEILARLLIVRLALSKRSREAADIADDEWDKVSLQGVRSHTVVDPAPRERYATYALSTMESRRNARLAKADADAADAAVDVARLLYRGLDATRQDLHVLIKAASWEQQMER